MKFDKLKYLEKEAKKLDLSAEERMNLRNSVVGYTENFIEALPDHEKMPTYQLSEDKGGEILDYPIGEPFPLDKLIALVENNVDKEGLNPASGGHLGYIPGGGIYSSSLGDYWAAITNRYAGVFFANPGAVRMENHLINWMKSMIGYPENALGNLASGGSIANLIAIVTAREAKNLRPADYEKAVVYLSPQTHHCLDKALRIAGLQHAKWRKVPLDDQYRMKPDMLKILIEEDRANGLNPWLIIASAGTTDTGALDPLNELADIAERENLWLHIDGAYGAFFVLLEEFKNKLKGLGRADSVVMDPHKGMFIPYGLGVVLVKDGDAVKNAFHYTANYMQDTVQHIDETSPAEVSPELTKHFRGLRMWLPLMYHGVEPFKANLEEKILLAQYFYEELSKEEGWELGPYPQMSVVTFRYIPASGDINEFNKLIIKKVHEDGRVFLSSTNIAGKFIIRLAVLSFRTHKATIDLALEMLREKVAKIKNAPAKPER